MREHFGLFVMVQAKSVDTGRKCPKCSGPIVRRPSGRTDCRDCKRAKSRREAVAHSDRLKGYRAKYVRQFKAAVIAGYGGKCQCPGGCSEYRYEFLTIDHVNNDGMEHRKKAIGTRRAGTGFYRWIVKSGFPKELRLLCMNCNFARGRYGYCPHEREAAVVVPFEL